jgi:16S rRNA (adenine1518-N6/adenine1519-N6)-dimethyltransferase
VPHKKARHPDQAHRLLRSAGLKARKGLGQNFLTDNNIRDEILAAASLSPGDMVIEVGPGLGMLTEELVKVAGKVVAVELDDSLAERLRKKLKSSDNIEVVSSDILKLDLQSVLKGAGSYKVVANIPYYITSPILHYFMHAGTRPVLMVIMMQKEVAEDVTAPPGKMNFMSVSMRIFSRPEMVCVVPAASFYPAPRVDSAVVRFNILEQPAVQVEDLEKFLEFIHCGFSAPRKKIRNSLSLGLKIEADEADKLLLKAGIDPQSRPGALLLEEWTGLYEARGESR